jgi:hypothetical protein
MRAVRDFSLGKGMPLTVTEDFEVAFEDSEGLVLFGMAVGWRTTAGRNVLNDSGRGPIGHCGIDENVDTLSENDERLKRGHSLLRSNEF